MKTQYFHTNEKSSYLPKGVVSFIKVQLIQPMSNRFTAAFRSLYHKMALILFTM